MFNFLKYLFKWVGFLLIAAVGLDIIYSLIYLNFDADRSVVQKAIFSKGKHYNYIVLGSSRGTYHVDVPLIDKTYGVSGYNFSYPAARSNESLHLLKILLNNGNKIDRIFVQIDNDELYFDDVNPDTTALKSFMPFIYNSDVWGYYYKYSELRPMLLIPFYRYIVNRPNIGERELLMTLIKKSGDHKKGFTPLKNKRINKPNVPGDYPKPLNSKNRNLTEIIEICERQGIRYEFFTTPVYKFDNSVNQLFHDLYQERYKDFSLTVQCDSCFRDAVHLNYRGAEILTNKFMEHYFSHEFSEVLASSRNLSK